MQLEPRNTNFSTPARCAASMHVVLDQQIVANELGRAGVVGVDAADPRGGQ